MSSLRESQASDKVPRDKTRGTLSAQQATEQEPSVPEPEDFPLAPTNDVATVRVILRGGDGRVKPYFWGRAFRGGKEVGQTSATNEVAALAGAVAILVERAQTDASGAADAEGGGDDA